MLFNSFEYLLLFLPLTLLGYFALRPFPAWGVTWLTAASLFFYAWWQPWHLPIIVGSIIFNFWVGQRIGRGVTHRHRWLALGIAINLLLLGIYKYSYFLWGSLVTLWGGENSLTMLALPLGISFFTFTQIAYLVDTARGDVSEPAPMHYALFVTFFPHLLAGPILHHKEMMPQFADATNRRFNAENFARGLFLLAIGLGKKVLIADQLAVHANAGFADPAALSSSGAWVTTLAYTLQIYFDFSGYTDMALGAALMFNIKLPINFDSPYLTTNIQDFWRRWHVTLSRFLRDYVYIPLGGNRGSEFRVSSNLLLTFLIGGLWHGAGWTFIIWGGLHGTALVVHRLWTNAGLRLPAVVGWIFTLTFVHMTWVFFRAHSVSDAITILKKMAAVEFTTTVSGMVHAYSTALNGLPYRSPSFAIVITAAIALALVPRNSNGMSATFKARAAEAALAVVLLTAGMLSLGNVTQFLYFNF
jgi:alginate O-acetyltransferase complex protein AlgI